MELADVLRTYNGPGYDRAMIEVYKGLISRPRLMSLIPHVYRHGSTKFLEVFCGTGLNFPYYPKGVNLTAIDIHPNMLELAEQRARAIDFANLARMDARQMAFPDESFDMAIESLGLCVTPEPKKALQEMARVTKNGGRIAIFDMCVSPLPSIALAQQLMGRQTSTIGYPERVIVWDPNIDLDALAVGLPLTLLNKELINQDTPWCCGYYAWEVKK